MYCQNGQLPQKPTSCASAATFSCDKKDSLQLSTNLFQISSMVVNLSCDFMASRVASSANLINCINCTHLFRGIAAVNIFRRIARFFVHISLTDSVLHFKALAVKRIPIEQCNLLFLINLSIYVERIYLLLPWYNKYHLLFHR